MTPPRRTPTHLRRRLGMAFAGAVVVTALVVTLGSYFLVGIYLRDRAIDEALAQSRFNLRFAEALLPAEPAQTDFERLLQALATRGDFETLVTEADESLVSGPGASRDLITPELQDAVGRGQLGYQPVHPNSVTTLVVGGRLPGGEARLYFFYPQGEREELLDRLGLLLSVAGLVLALAGALLGWGLAGRVLRPVYEARVAAGRMAAGNLDVRLPEGRDEFGELSADFNRMASSLQARMEELEEARRRERQFTADVAHELRTPVSALVGEASLLEQRLSLNADGTIPVETRRAAELLVRDVARLRRLVDDLLEISRLDAGAVDLNRVEFSVIDFLERMGEARGWPDDVRVTGDRRLTLCTDPRRLERIVVNLVENALRHGEPPVVVEARRVEPTMSGAAAAAESVGGHPAAGELALSVTDFGFGILAEHQERVFDRFYKTDPSRGERPGSGLGLAIVWENARLLGGAVSVKSSPEEGTRFTLRLPLLADSASLAAEDEDTLQFNS